MAAADELVGGGVDSARWAAILRSVSAHRSFRWVYRDAFKPWHIADFLMLNAEMPRSLRSCYGQIVVALTALADHYGRPAPCQKLAEKMLATLKGSQMSEIYHGFGNLIHLFSASEPHREISILARGTVEVTDCSGVVQGLADMVRPRVYLRRTALTTPDAAIADIAAATAGLEPIARLDALLGGIRDRVEYRTGRTGAETTAAEAFAAGEGVCQDHAHIFIAAAGAAAIPARYVTGYLLIGDHAPAAAQQLGEAAKLVLQSLDSTLRSNLSVGMPIDLLIYERDTLDVRRVHRIEESDAYFRSLSASWSEALRSPVAKMEPFQG